jgi:hypothetical protein
MRRDTDSFTVPYGLSLLLGKFNHVILEGMGLRCKQKYT